MRARHATNAIETLVVVVPVHNEEALLPRCIDSLAAAADHLARAEAAPDLIVTLVLDSCDDRSSQIAKGSPFDTVQITANNVGIARAAGIDAALSRVATQELSRVWIANTDADSAVPRNWLSHQVGLAASGAQLMIGTVRPDPDDLDPARRERWSCTHVLGEANGHVHGANLGVRADLYRSVGGFEPVAEHEDIRLAGRIRATEALAVATDECWVLTSGRFIGRTPGGYARYIRDDLLRTDACAGE
jgi:glycosyltransferase involved in cell wall biosynthesis